MAARGRPFGAGNPGNMAGRPRGARNRTTLAVEALLDGEAQALTRKAIELALAGDGAALRLCLDRICPPRRDRAIVFALPAINEAGDLPGATEALLKAVTHGDLTPNEAAEIGRVVDTHMKAIELQEFGRRLRALESSLGANPAANRP